MSDLSLPSSVERRNKLDIALGYCNELDPRVLVSLGPANEIRVDDPSQLVLTRYRSHAPEERVETSADVP